MPAGIFVNGSHGYRQVDDTYSNLALHYKGNATCSTSVGLAGSAMFYVNITVTASQPLIAWRSPSAPVAFMSRQETSPGQWTFNFWGPSGTTFTYYVFDNPQPGGSGGFEVLNAAGERTFWSGYKYMKVAAMLSGPDFYSGLGERTFTAGRTYATCQSIVSYEYENLYLPGGSSAYEHEVIRRALATQGITNGIRLNVADHQTFIEDVGSAGSSFEIHRLAYLLLILDVTGY